MEYNNYCPKSETNQSRSLSRVKRWGCAVLLASVLVGGKVAVTNAIAYSSAAKVESSSKKSERFGSLLAGYDEVSDTEAPEVMYLVDTYDEAAAIFNSKEDPAYESESDSSQANVKDIGEYSLWDRGKEKKGHLFAVKNLSSNALVSTPGTKYYVDGSEGKAVLNERAAIQASKMVEAMERDLGHEIVALSSFRPSDQQTDLYTKQYGKDNLELCKKDPSKAPHLAVACPYYSEHGAGGAIDFFLGDKYPATTARIKAADGREPTPDNPAVAIGNDVWEWLHEHGQKYGFYQQYNEDWHWGYRGYTPRSDLQKDKNLDRIMRFFIEEKGISPAAAAGIAGNLKQESGYNPAIIEGGKVVADDYVPVDGTGFGLAQWTFSGRQKPLVDFAKSRGSNVNDLDTQLEFMWHELETSYKESTLDKIKNETDPIKAAYIFHKYYEISADTEEMVRNGRGGPAEAIYKQLVQMDGEDGGDQSGEENVPTETTPRDMIRVENGSDAIEVQKQE